MRRRTSCSARSSRRTAALVAGVLTLLLSASAAAQAPTVGLLTHDPRRFDGYTLFSPMLSSNTYLIDINGMLVNSWTASGTPGLMGYLTEEGHLLRAVSLAPNLDPRWNSAVGGGGRLEEYDWDGTLLWSIDYASPAHLQHHDFLKLPNGNVIMIVWEWKSTAEAIAAGRDPGRLGGGAFWPDMLIEVEPTPPVGGNVVWEWHVWDHLVQELDPTKANYAPVADHPELIHINAVTDDGAVDFNHLNGLAYNAELDQLIMSSRGFNEFWVIDHSTTTAEAASHTGGRSGRGGDILYRWGHPLQYRRGVMADRTLYNQHDAQWIAPGHPGAGNILVYNNGGDRPGGAASSVDEIVPPLNPSGTYDIGAGAFEPAAPTWTYMGTPRSSFYSAIISGAERLPNGNTLITEGVKGNIFEVTSAGEIVWRYVNPVIGSGPLAQGATIPQGPFIRNNAVFKARRYAPDYPGLQGRDLTPGPHIETFTAPRTVPDGSLGTSPFRPSKLDPAAADIQVAWDVVSCPSDDYHLILGSLVDVASLRLSGDFCRLGTTGSAQASGVPSGDLFMLLVGVSRFGIYESGWGADSFGRERNGTHPSLACGVTTKAISACP